jgi:hypothetical protein
VKLCSGTRDKGDIGLFLVLSNSSYPEYVPVIDTKMGIRLLFRIDLKECKKKQKKFQNFC